MSGTLTAPTVSILVTTSFSATPAFDGTNGQTFKITLTGDVTSSTITNITSGHVYTFIIVQDSTGSRAFAWPANVLNPMVVDPSPNAVSTQQFVYDGSNLYAISAGTVT